MPEWIRPSVRRIMTFIVAREGRLNREMLIVAAAPIFPRRPGRGAVLT
jgi:hypothetical protein